MKKIIIALMITLPLFVQGQKKIDVFPEIDGIVTYKEVVQVDSSLSANELYTRAKIWMANSYVSANNVIQMSDKEEGKIVGKGFTRVAIPSFLVDVKVDVDHTISISVKKGKYQYVINPGNSKWWTDNALDADERLMSNVIPRNTTKGLYVKACIATDEKIKKLIESLKKAMAKPASEDNF